jgi:small conductance mechanosensitive channel
MILQQSPTPPAAPPDTLIGFFDQLRAQAFAALPKFFTALIVFLVFLIIAWFGKRLIAVTAPRVRADTGVMLLLSRVFYYGVLTFGTIIALSTTGLDVSALIAGLGLTGFALGFALKDVLSNLLSGIMLLIYRPFHIGDEIVMGAFEGTIQTIRMRDTILRGADGRTIVIPNTKLITEVVVNNSTRELARETVRIRLSADAEVGAACDVFAHAMENEKQTVARVEPEISVKRGREGTILGGFFWLDPRRTNAATAREQVVDRIKQAFDEAGVPAEVTSVNRTGTKTEPEKREDEENTPEKPSEI